MLSEDTNSESACPVDNETRKQWLEAAKAGGQPAPVHPPASPPMIQRSPAVQDAKGLDDRHDNTRFSLDTGRWQPFRAPAPRLPPVAPSTPQLRSLPTDREISTIPRAPTNHDRQALNSAEQAALPANNEKDTGHDRESGNWIYPSQDMFFNAMKRKGHDAQSADMATIVPIHNAVNERA